MKYGTGEKTVILIAAAVIVIAGLRFAQPILIPLCLAVAIATLTQPVVTWLERRKLPHVLAIVIAVVLDLGVIAGIVSVASSSAQDFYTRLPDYQAKIGAIIRGAMTALASRGLHVSPDQTTRLVEVNRLVELGSSAAKSIAALVSDSILVLMLVVFMLLEVSRWRVKIAYIMGSPTGDISRFKSAAEELQNYLVVKSIMCLITAVLSGTWVAIWGVDFVLLWAVIAFVLNYIPTIGSILAGIPPVLVALVQLGPGPALGVAIGYAVINVVLGTAIEPRVMGRALGLSPLVVLLSMVFWGSLWGPVGALLSAPLTMAVKVMLANTTDMRWLAILLGSSSWVERMNDTWSKEAASLSKLTPPDSHS
jgi:predicted PurR-regulated permease PerM